MAEQLSKENTMEADCMVSVLCTVYNHESYLRDALDSIVCQKTSFAFELLINDDASTDGTAEIIREYQEKYPDIVRPFFQKENMYSRDIDIYQVVFYPNARGKYVAFCEGDDYWTDDSKLQRQVDFLEAHPEYSACVHNTTLHYCNGEVADAPLLPHDSDRDIRPEDVIPGMITAYHTSSLMAKKALLAAPPDYYYVACEYGFGDYPDALWLLENGPVWYLDRCMSVYRCYSNTLSWSSGVAKQYGKLKRFVIGKRELLKTYLPHAADEYKPLVEQVILEREFELMYIEGRDREQRRAPYDKILRAQPFRYRAVNFVKCLFPRLQRLYRKRKGYEDY